MNDFMKEIWAVALRDLRKRGTFIKYFLSIILITSIIFLIGVGFDTFIDFSEYGSSYSKFFSPGIIVFFIVSMGLQMGVELITDRKGFIKLLLVAPISRYSILFGKILSGFISSLKSFFIIAILFLLLFNEFSLIKIVNIFIFMIFIIITYHSFGLWLSSMFNNRETAQEVIGYLSFAMLFLSGIFYPIQALPKFVQYIIYINPLTYTVDLFRYIMIGEHYFSIILNIFILLVFGLISLFLGVYQFDRNLRR